MGFAGERLGPRVTEPFVAEASDIDVRVQIGAGDPRTVVTGAGSGMLSWLLGRAEPEELNVRGGELPALPPWG
jgi:hypothetical protein